MIFAADLNSTALTIFGIVVAITLGITYWASKRTSTATEFWAAGRGITGMQNGFAIAGDYMSAASFLGIAGLIYLFGFDGFLYSVGFLVAFLTVLFLLAERMRNAGKYTMADVLAFRMHQRPARAAAALGTLSVAAFYLIAQMVGAGVLLQPLTGLGFEVSVIITGVFMITYVVFGGMLATTWVQIIEGRAAHDGHDAPDDPRVRPDRQPDRPVQRRPRREPRGRCLPRARPAVRQADRHDLARPRARARHRGPAAHPHAVLHRAHRQGGAQQRRVGDLPDRRLLPHDHGARLRRAGHPRRHRGGRQGRQPRRAAARARSSAEALGPRAAISSWRSSPRSPSRRSSRWSPGS